MARITRRKVENTAERMIVTGMVVSSEYMSQVAGVYDPSFLVAPFSKTVAQWCVDYYKTYNKCPGIHIKDIFDRHKDDPAIDDETMDTVESFLEGISAEYERADNFNVDYLVKETETYFRRRNLLNVMERGRVALENECDPADVESLIAQYKSPLLTASQSVSILENPDWWGEEDEDVQTLFSYPGALGELIGPVERDSFIALLAPEKRGKTGLLLDASMRCVRAGFNAAVFQVGDLTEKQAKARFRSILTGHSARLLRKKFIYVPVLDCEFNQTGSCPTGRCPDNEKMYDAGSKKSKKKKSETDDDDPKRWKPDRFLDAFPDHKPCTICIHGKERQHFFKGAPWWAEMPTADIKARPLKDELDKAKRRRWGHIELFVRPADSFTVEDIDRALMIFQHQRGITFDMIVIDYADILKASNEKDEFRHRENKKWMAMRGLSQKWNASLWTGTQARKNDKENMDTEEMAEDKRKMAHVTSFLAMNQTKIEKARGILRISQFLARDDDFDSTKNVHILQSVATGRPVIASYW